jgi:DNA mismatch repair ATPase MutS
MLRNRYKNEFNSFIQTIYLLDAYISVSKVANEKCLTFTDYIDNTTPTISIKKLYHPLLTNAVPYDVEITKSNNLCFLTGPNMAGKSTFLKSLGVAMYISHLGFPVPAEKMSTTIYNGIITTINLSDSMNRGYSHFYSEVRRVKEVAMNLKEKNRLLVIFDELFRGTNVKDAFDASLLIIESFAKINKSTFFVSTHITEVAEKLTEFTNIDFKYFDSELVDDLPVYKYELKDGVSHERLGMHILKNEKIIEILNSIAEN